MNRTTSIAIGVLVVIIVAAGGVYAVVKSHNSSKSSSSSSNSENMPMPVNSSNHNAAAAATDKVTIANFAFSPADITVKAGTTVTWTNNDSVAHTVTETDGQTGPASGDIGSGSAYTFTFSKAGTYHYHCAIHPSMTGTVTVTS